MTGTGVSRPSRRARPSSTCWRTAAGPSAAAGRWTVLDLDWRPMFWPSPQDARREYELMLEHVNVAVGNRAEVEVAVGTADPEEAARRLLDHGVELALVKKGGEGVLVATRDAMRAPCAPQLVDVVCGLGAGDAFGGALVHGLLSGWDPVRIAGYANAAGAIVVARLACADAMPTARGARGHGRRTVACAVTRCTAHGHAAPRSRKEPDDGAADQRRAVARAAGDPGHRPARGGRGLREPPAARAAPLRPGHHLPGGGRPPGARGPRVRRRTRWRWPTGAGCSSGW